jgi:hypothetical protein
MFLLSRPADLDELQSYPTPALFLSVRREPRDHAFLRAWQDINREVSQSCWEALNIYVMIVTGEQAKPAENGPPMSLMEAIRVSVIQTFG